MEQPLLTTKQEGNAGGPAYGSRLLPDSSGEEEEVKVKKMLMRRRTMTSHLEAPKEGARWCKFKAAVVAGQEMMGL